MARRKQQNPKHLETSQELATSLQNGITASSDSEDDEHVCGKCRAEFPSLSDFLKHKIFCVSKRPVLVYADHNGNKDDSVNSKEVDCALSDDDPPPTLTAMDSAFPNGEYRNYSSKLHDLPQLVQQLSATNVTLEELRNTTVAVSQHGRVLQESQLAALLSNIHQQQVAQLHVIQELQAQILGSPASPASLPLVGTAALTPPQSGSEGAMGGATPNNNQPSAPVSARTCTMNSNGNALSLAAPPQNGAVYEPNTLELLQRHTEKALQQTMSSGTFLLSNMGLKRVKDGKLDDSSQRHRCRFCGKFFGSDSALQIHVRSHTGERPFKCSICGSCFSTKGNLKVHFQRHRERMEVPNDLMNGDLSNPPNLNGESSVPLNANDELDQSDKALDFSTSAETNKSPPTNADQANGPSRSKTQNEISALSDDSADISVDGTADERNDHHEYDDDDEDDDRGSNLSATNDNIDGDSDNQQGSHSSPFTSPSFGSFFRPSHYSSVLSENPANLSQRTSTGSAAAADNVQLHQDPSLYQDLLPRIGSNDNSWESLMEVTETSETSKLQKLVDNIEVADPNQCIICHRVLSCRSALQMHYRTHTGERPFKCKICGRAFTTKGNLKTHMGVHRHKPPSRILHQCPVCHKQFANSIILQQHIRMHTAVTSAALPDQLYYAENKNSTLLPPSYPRPMLLPPHLSNPEPLALTSSDTRYQTDSSAKTPDSVIKVAKSDGSQQRSCVSSPAASVSSGDGANGQPDDCSATTEDPKHQESNKVLEDLPPSKSCEGNVSPISVTPEENENATDELKDSLKDDVIDPTCVPADSKTEVCGSVLKSESPPSIQHSKKNSASSQIGIQEQSLPKIESVRDHPMLLNLPNDKPLPMTLPSDCPIPLSLQTERQLMSMSIPNSQSEFTASLTALENHVKAINSSTTNPLPFPPPYGLGFSLPPYYRHEYGFGAYAAKEKSSRSYSPSNSKAVSDTSADDRSTPGSVVKSDSPKTRSESGALDLTPRGSSTDASSVQRSSGDLKVFTPLAGLPFPPPHTRIGTTCQLCFKTFACQSALEIHYRSHTKERPFKCDVCDRGFSTKGNMKQHMLTHKIRDLPPQLFTSNSSVTTSTILPATTAGTGTTNPSSKKFDETSKRSVSDSGHSPKRPPGIPKHVCEVCRKPFSSGSALQIHMRTHTGVKPFQCNICSRAFTTKGNLKVHMGTHLSNSGTSRRGRRMSLDISPLSLPLGKPGEYPRPDMFFPYLPPFMKGALPQQPPKMNEISVIQSAVSREDVVNAAASLSSAALNTTHVSSFVSSIRPLAMLTSTAHQQQQQQQQPRADDKARVDSGRRSPVRNADMSSSSNAQVSDIAIADRNASWGWKIACNRCNKICSSSADLELHISTEHMKKETVENLSVVSQPKSAA